MVDDNAKRKELADKVEDLIGKIVNQKELKCAVRLSNIPFVLFNYPGGLSYMLKQDGELHRISENCDKGTTSLHGAASYYADRLRLYDEMPEPTDDELRAKIQREIGDRAEEAISRYRRDCDSGRLPEEFRPRLSD